jgi:hypothetical protein
MNNPSPSHQLNITHYPFGMWGFGLLWLLFTGSMVLGSNFSLPRDLGVLLMVVVPVAICVFAPSIQTISADKITRILTIKKVRPVFGTHITEIPIDEIADCQLESSTTQTDHGLRYVYRIIIVKKSGEIVPVSRAFTGGRDDQADIVNRVVAFLGLPGNAPVVPSLANLPQILQTQVNQSRASFGAPQVTEGITWQLDKHVVSQMTFVRWISSDFSWPGQNFLLILQESSKNMTNRSRITFERTRRGLFQTIGVYGFSKEDLPGLANAEMLPPNPQLDASFMCIANAPDTAAKLLNAEITNTLLYWNQSHPAKKASIGDHMVQVVLLFSPRGTYLCAFGQPTAAELDDMIALGIEIVRMAQRAVMPQFF